MQPNRPPSLRALLERTQRRTDVAIVDGDGRVKLSDALAGTCMPARDIELAGQSILLATPDQLTTALALIELDGLARRVVLCPPDIDPRHNRSIAERADIDVVVSGPDASVFGELGRPVVVATRDVQRGARRVESSVRTEWVLLTSGTTGMPKLARHDLASLIAPIKLQAGSDADLVWATFYDIRRYGGLQIYLRALLGASSMILSHEGEAIELHLARLGRCGVTHISGTPSHWRRVLMSGMAEAMTPRYIRLSGEIADQSVLDALQVAYPAAGVSHAYASTEAGVGFNVIDGKEGFPASLVGDDDANGGVAIRIVNGTLWLRSARTATCYLGPDVSPIRDPDGFVDTGDLVELRGDRYVFFGRRGGVINVDGQKVHPEEIEMTINRHPAVQGALVRARRSPITGALVVADVVVNASAHQVVSGTDLAPLAADILQYCRDHLAPYKVPTRISFVPHLDVAASGKMARHHE